MKRLKIQIKRLIYLLGVILILTSCKKDDSEGTTAKTGNWTGEGITFSVNSSPLKLSNLEFAYSGHASGNLCSFDYESTASFAQGIEVSGNDFTAEISTFSISGVFTNDTVAEIEITWTNYDSNCDANYTGNRLYTAHYQQIK